MALSEDMMSKCSEHLSAYKAACEEHPDLKSFDSSLQKQTNKVIDSLTAEAEKQNNKVIDLLTAKAEKRTNKEIESLTAEANTGLLLSQHAAVTEVSKHLHEVSQGVADFIVKSEDDVWENKTIRSLVKDYFENTKKTIDILNNVTKCVDKAEMGQVIILQAVARFDKESADKDVVGKKKYEKTLKKLKKFKDMGNPFDGSELTTQLELVKKQQESLLEKVSAARKKLQEEYDNFHRGSVISTVVCAVVGLGIAVTSIALLATGVGGSLGIALALSLPVIAILWTVAYTIIQRRMDDLKRQEEALKELEDVLKSEGKGIETNKIAMESVSVEVHRLETKILSILEVVDNGLESEEEETDTRLALNLIKEKVTKLTEGIKEVGEAVSRSTKLILDARYQVLKKMSGSA